ncbi:MAG: hypothetical protein RL033_6110 [Pseudomonadota bacterium]|jgi:glycosyltransferase involved in cell wall biosynthesis
MRTLSKQRWRTDNADRSGWKRHPRVLIVASHADSLVKFRGDLIRTLLARGVEVHAAAPDCEAHSESAELLIGWGVVLHELALQRTGLNPLRDLNSLFELYRMIQEVQPTHLLVYTVKPVIYGLLAARLAGGAEATALITGLGYAFSGEGASWKRRAVQRVLLALYRGALGGARRVVFQNPDDRALFVQLGLVRSERSAVVDGSGVNLDEYAVAPLPPLHAPLRFLLIARLIRDKGIGEFVAAGRQLRRVHPGVELHLVGGLDENPESVSHAELQGWMAEGSVVYHGHLRDVRPVIASCHVFVLPSFYREGIPRTLLEAMAMARPVITCDAPGCRETVVAGENGYLVPVRDVAALAAAMLRFVQDPESVRSMGEAARRLVERRYDVVKVNGQMLVHMGLDGGATAGQGPEQRARSASLNDL